MQKAAGYSPRGNGWLVVRERNRGFELFKCHHNEHYNGPRTQQGGDAGGRELEHNVRSQRRTASVRCD